MSSSASAGKGGRRVGFRDDNDDSNDAVSDGVGGGRAATTTMTTATAATAEEHTDAAAPAGKSAVVDSPGGLPSPSTNNATMMGKKTSSGDGGGSGAVNRARSRSETDAAATTGSTGAFGRGGILRKKSAFPSDSEGAAAAADRDGGGRIAAASSSSTSSRPRSATHALGDRQHPQQYSRGKGSGGGGGAVGYVEKLSARAAEPMQGQTAAVSGTPPPGPASSALDGIDTINSEFSTSLLKNAAAADRQYHYHDDDDSRSMGPSSKPGSGSSSNRGTAADASGSGRQRTSTQNQNSTATSATGDQRSAPKSAAAASVGQGPSLIYGDVVPPVLVARGILSPRFMNLSGRAVFFRPFVSRKTGGASGSYVARVLFILASGTLHIVDELGVPKRIIDLTNGDVRSCIVVVPDDQSSHDGDDGSSSSLGSGHPRSGSFLSSGIGAANEDDVDVDHGGTSRLKKKADSDSNVNTKAKGVSSSSTHASELVLVVEEIVTQSKKGGGGVLGVKPPTPMPHDLYLRFDDPPPSVAAALEEQDLKMRNEGRRRGSGSSIGGSFTSPAAGGPVLSSPGVSARERGKTILFDSTVSVVSEDGKTTAGATQFEGTDGTATRKDNKKKNKNTTATSSVPLEYHWDLPSLRDFLAVVRHFTDGHYLRSAIKNKQQQMSPSSSVVPPAPRGGKELSVLYVRKSEVKALDLQLQKPPGFRPPVSSAELTGTHTVSGSGGGGGGGGGAVWSPVSAFTSVGGIGRNSNATTVHHQQEERDHRQDDYSKSSSSSLPESGAAGESSSGSQRGRQRSKSTLEKLLLGNESDLKDFIATSYNKSTAKPPIEQQEDQHQHERQANNEARQEGLLGIFGGATSPVKHRGRQGVVPTSSSCAATIGTSTTAGLTFRDHAGPPTATANTESGRRKKKKKTPAAAALDGQPENVEEAPSAPGEVEDGLSFFRFGASLDEDNSDGFSESHSSMDDSEAGSGGGGVHVASSSSSCCFPVRVVLTAEDVAAEEAEAHVHRQRYEKRLSSSQQQQQLHNYHPHQVACAGGPAVPVDSHRDEEDGRSPTAVLAEHLLMSEAAVSPPSASSAPPRRSGDKGGRSTTTVRQLEGIVRSLPKELQYLLLTEHNREQAPTAVEGQDVAAVQDDEQIPTSVPFTVDERFPPAAAGAPGMANDTDQMASFLVAYLRELTATNAGLKTEIAELKHELVYNSAAHSHAHKDHIDGDNGDADDIDGSRNSVPRGKDHHRRHRRVYSGHHGGYRAHLNLSMLVLAVCRRQLLFRLHDAATVDEQL